MNSSGRSTLSRCRGEEQEGLGVAGFDSMEQRCYPRASSPPRDLEFNPDGGRGGGEKPAKGADPYTAPDSMIKLRERERIPGYHSSSYYSPWSSGDRGDQNDRIKHYERELMMTTMGDSGGYPHHSSASRYQQQEHSPHEGSWQDGPVSDMHYYGGVGRHNDSYADTMGYHRNSRYDLEHAIQNKEADYAGRATHENMIEVVPGFRMRLRGARETWAAVERDFFGPATCFSCEMTVFCILDAEYVLCPDCKVVFPFEQDGGGGEKSKNGAGGGVGLGFSMEDLARFQSDIVSRYS